MIIVLSGGKQHGKDTVAQMLIEEFPKRNFRRAALADEMKKLTCGLLNTTLEEIEELKTSEAVKITDECVIKNGVTMRQFLQNIGQELKELFGDYIWTDILINKMYEDENYILTDCRFAFEEKEFEYLAHQFDEDYLTIRVTNPRVPLGGDKHVSEQGYKDIPFMEEIINDGTLEDLRKKVKEIGEKYV